MKIQENTKTSSQSRKWLLTLNNPDEKDVTFDKVADILKGLRSIEYYCISSEIGEQGTKHYHLFVYSGKSAIRFSTLKKRFEKWHIDRCSGTVTECINYVKKSGDKWANTSKGDTSTGEILEYGKPPNEDDKHPGKRGDLEQLLSGIQEGKSDLELILSNPKNIRYLSHIERVRQTVLYEKAKSEIRVLECYYITGCPGVGKSKFIYDTFGSKAYRVTDYKAPFDGYNGEDVLVFEEFDSNTWSASNGGITTFLNVTDIYPTPLHARFYNKWACYTKVFIISNLPLEKQFADVRENGDISTYRAFRRRIHHSYEFVGDGEYIDTNNPLVRYKISDLSKKFG